MAVSFIAAGAISDDLVGAAAFTPAVPAHIANDILIASLWNEGGSKPSTATSGWAEIATGAGTADATWYWKRAAGAGTAGPDVTAADTDCFGQVNVYRGCAISGTPYVNPTKTGDGGTTDTTPDTATISTTNVNQFVVCFLNHGDDINFASGFPPSTWTADSNIQTGDGTDAGFQTISKTVASASSVGTVVIGTWTTGEAYWAVTLAFIPQPVSALTGTITSSVKESDIVAGGKTLIITLTDDNWIAAGAASFDLQRAAIIAGCTSAQGETLGWNLVPKALQTVAGVVRTSNTVVTITWDAFATYDITAQETITVTVPAAATVGGISTVATPTFTVAAGAASGSFARATHTIGGSF